MIDISIDADICIKDDLCAMTCPISLIVQNKKGTVPTIRDDRDGCFQCGQCVAVCPQGTISHSHFPEGTVTPIHTEDVATYDQVLGLIRSRRSQRSFKEKAVERDVIEKVLEAARFGPSGHNEQSTEFVVVQDRETITEIGRLTAAALKKTGIPFNYAIGRMMMRAMMGKRGAEYLGELAPEFIGLADMYNKGEDLILHDAPALILFCADSVGGTFAGINANIALHNAALAAETVGLGCFYTGFVVIVSERDDSIANLLACQRLTISTARLPSGIRG